MPNIQDSSCIVVQNKLLDVHNELTAVNCKMVELFNNFVPASMSAFYLIMRLDQCKRSWECIL